MNISIDWCKRPQYTSVTRELQNSRFMMSLILNSICSGINIINIALHGIGVILLATLFKNGDRSFQQLYLLNLATSQLIKNTLGAAHALSTVGSTDYVPDKSALWVALWTGINYNVICAMFYITGDRLLQVCHNLKYSKVYWSVKKTCILIIITWIINVLISVSFSVSHVVATNLKPTLVVSYPQLNVSADHLNFSDPPIVNRTYEEHIASSKRHLESIRNDSDTIYLIDRIKYVIKIFDTYIPPTLEVTYLIFAVVTYLVMFSKYVQSKRTFEQSDSSAITLFLHSRFFIPVLLISSYLIFTVIPTIIVIVWWWTSPNYAVEAFRIFVMCTKISVRLSCTVQAFIYLFIKPQVRTLFFRKVCCTRKIYSNKNHNRKAIRRARPNLD